MLNIVYIIYSDKEQIAVLLIDGDMFELLFLKLVVYIVCLIVN